MKKFWTQYEHWTSSLCSLKKGKKRAERKSYINISANYWMLLLHTNSVSMVNGRWFCLRKMNSNIKTIWYEPNECVNMKTTLIQRANVSVPEPHLARIYYIIMERKCMCLYVCSVCLSVRETKGWGRKLSHPGFWCTASEQTGSYSCH